MRIRVVPRVYVEKELSKKPDWYVGKWIISIYSSGLGVDWSPFPDRFNVLQLHFDDVTEKDIAVLFENMVFFDTTQAKAIHEFIEKIPAEDKRMFYVHCDAGVSRSGAVGYLLNEWFNKYLTDNKEDYEYFKRENNHILLNPLVVRILKEELFGKPFAGIDVNDYTYNEDGERIDHKEEI